MAAVPLVGEQSEETMERARGKRKIELEHHLVSGCASRAKNCPATHAANNESKESSLKENGAASFETFCCYSILLLFLLSWILLITMLRKSTKKNPLSKIFLLKKIID